MRGPWCYDCGPRHYVKVADRKSHVLEVKRRKKEEALPVLVNDHTDGGLETRLNEDTSSQDLRSGISTMDVEPRPTDVRSWLSSSRGNDQHSQDSVTLNTTVFTPDSMREVKRRNETETPSMLVNDRTDSGLQTRLTEDTSSQDLRNAIVTSTLMDVDSSATDVRSRLWSSRDDYQNKEDSLRLVTPSMTDFNPDGMRESLDVLLHHNTSSPPHSMPIDPSSSLSPTRFPLHAAPDPIQTDKDICIVPTAEQTVHHPPSSSSPDHSHLPYTRSGRPIAQRGRARPRPSKSGSTDKREHGEKSLSIIDAIDQEATELLQDLMSKMPVDDGDAELVAERHRELNDATAQAGKLSAGLLAIHRVHQDVYTRRNQVMNTLRQIENVITLLGSNLPRTVSNKPVDYYHLYVDPLLGKSLIARLTIFLGVACSLIIGISKNSCDFIIGAVRLVAGLAVTAGWPEHTQESRRQSILDQMPTSIYTALGALNLDSQSVVMAVCPSCSYNHEPIHNRLARSIHYPTRCDRRVLREKGREPCGALLVEHRHGAERPLKPFALVSIEESLARVLSDPSLERYCNDACDKALNHYQDPHCRNQFNSVFEADFLRTFRGPPPHNQKLFVVRDGKVRLALALQVDFFNPNGTRRRGNHDSIGLISFAILNLPLEIRYKPENLILVGVIPGPREPNFDELQEYLRPVIDMCLVGWQPGIRTRTASQPDGCVVEFAVVISINDLPAARKVAGGAGIKSTFCTACISYHRVLDSSFETWEPRDPDEFKRLAEAYRDAGSLEERSELMVKGVRWSELWRLPYWDPTQMVVVDSMHCILEGLVRYHCLEVLRISEKEAKKAPSFRAAFTHEWTQYDPFTVPDDYRLSPDISMERQLVQITIIHDQLTRPLNSGQGTLSEQQLRKMLQKHSRPALRFVVWSLGRHNRRMSLGSANVHFTVPIPMKFKSHYVDALITWRLEQPLNSGPEPVRINERSIQHIQHVIQTTDLPTWVNSVPRNYGERSTGTIKADEWRTLATIFLPIALVTLWGTADASPQALEILQHTMDLFQAVDIVCRYTMFRQRAQAYQSLLKKWVDNLHRLHPHTRSHSVRPNIHIAFHIYDFILLFGPVSSWWAFPFERLIGVLEQVNTNNHIGGELEMTIFHTYNRAANFRRIVNRKDPSPTIQAFQGLLKKAFSSRYDRPETHNEFPNDSKASKYARYVHYGILYTQADTHLGNSLVRYAVEPSGTSVPGSIREIKTIGGEVKFLIQRQAPISVEEYDPFSRYPWFADATYSSRLMDVLDIVSPRQVICHVARFRYLDERVVILDLTRN